MRIQHILHILHILRAIAAILLSLAFWPVAAAVAAAEPKYDLPTRLVDEPAGIAQLRAQYASMTEAQLVAAGFEVKPRYVTAEMEGLSAATGAMGYHAINPALMGAQFPQGTMDAQHPPVVMLGLDKRVIGVEWEAADSGQAPPQLHGQTVNLGPRHPPGVVVPHYMLHAFFRPGGKVLFGDFDPTLATPGLPNTGAGGGQSGRLPTLPLVALALACAATVTLTTARRRAR